MLFNTRIKRRKRRCSSFALSSRENLAKITTQRPRASHKVARLRLFYFRKGNVLSLLRCSTVNKFETRPIFTIATEKNI